MLQEAEAIAAAAAQANGIHHADAPQQPSAGVSILNPSAPTMTQPHMPNGHELAADTPLPDRENLDDDGIAGPSGWIA